MTPSPGNATSNRVLDRSAAIVPILTAWQRKRIDCPKIYTKFNRGFGAGSRLSLDIEKLKEYGWKVNTRECTSSGSRRVYFSYINPQGGKVVKAVKRSSNLPKEGVLEEMLQKPHDAESASSVETVLPPKGIRFRLCLYYTG